MTVRSDDHRTAASGDRPGSGRVRVAVLGSCMSRDCFTNAMNPGYDENWVCLATQHQSSLVSMVSPPVAFDDADFAGMEPRDQWILREDLDKGFIANLVFQQPQVLVIDFWADVFFGFRRVGSTFVTDNDWTLPQSPFFARISRAGDTEAVTIEDDPGRFLRDWRAAAKQFRAFLDDQLPDTLVVLHRGRATDLLVEGDGASLTASGTCIPRDVARLNVLWSELDDIAVAELAADVIDVGGDRFPSTTAHRWGSGYVHYVDDYYHAVLAELACVVERSAARGSRRCGRPSRVP